MSRPFELLCEVEPSTRPDLDRVRRQIEVLRRCSDKFLVPDNHLGRATVSSIAVAHEVQQSGGQAIACLNARDRNLLGFRRDLLTAAAYGVRDLVFVYGDKPTVGDRVSDVAAGATPRHGARSSRNLTVRSMLEETRRLARDEAFADVPAFRVGVTSSLAPLPAWKADAEFLLAQVSFSVPDLVRWREQLAFDGKVYAGVIVLASVDMARRLRAAVPDITVPDDVLSRLASDRTAGVEVACELVRELRETEAFDGVHLVGGVRYRQMAHRLAEMRFQR
jgi:5,10-methylenetetrahydrofolate reductase